MQFSVLEIQKATSILISHPALQHCSQAGLVILSRLRMATLSASFYSPLHSAQPLYIGCSHKPLTGLAARRPSAQLVTRAPHISLSINTSSASLHTDKFISLTVFETLTLHTKRRFPQQQPRPTAGTHSS